MSNYGKKCCPMPPYLESHGAMFLLIQLFIGSWSVTSLIFVNNTLFSLMSRSSRQTRSRPRVVLLLSHQPHHLGSTTFARCHFFATHQSNMSPGLYDDQLIAIGKKKNTSYGGDTRPLARAPIHNPAPQLRAAS